MSNDDKKAISQMPERDLAMAKFYLERKEEQGQAKPPDLEQLAEVQKNLDYFSHRRNGA
jgi:hypothetical protein